MRISDPRRAVTIRLARQGLSLLRAIELNEPPSTTPPPMQGASLSSELVSLSHALDSGQIADLERLVLGDGAAAMGRALFETLFGAENQYLALLRELSGGRAPDSERQTLRVRIVTRDPMLAGLPWRLTAASGERLVDTGTTFEVTHEDALGPPPARTWNYVFVEAKRTAAPEYLPSPMLWRPEPAALFDTRFPQRDVFPRVLILSPHIDEKKLDSQAHARALRQKLADMGLPHNDPAFVRIVHTSEDLARALKGMAPDVLFVSAALESADERAAMVLEARGGGSAKLALSDLGNLLAKAPPVVLSVVSSALGPSPFPDLFAELAPRAPVVFLPRLADDDASPCLDALASLLGMQADPIAAAHAGLSKNTIGHVTLSACGAYAGFRGEQAQRPPSPFVVALRCALDAAREEAMELVASSSLGDETRVLALVFPEPPRATGAAGTRPLVDELDIAGRHLGRARVLAMPHVEPFEGEELLAAYKRALAFGIDADADSLEKNLRQCCLDGGWSTVSGTAPEASPEARPSDRSTFFDKPGERALLWLDFGSLGAAPRRPAKASEIRAFLQLAAEVLAPRCPPEIRIVCAIAVEVDADQHERLSDWMERTRAELSSDNEGFDAALLPRARSLSQEEVRSCFAEAWPEPCPASLLDRMTEAAFSRARGDIDETLAWVACAHGASWGAALRRLDPTEMPEADDEVI